MPIVEPLDWIALAVFVASWLGLWMAGRLQPVARNTR